MPEPQTLSVSGHPSAATGRLDSAGGPYPIFFPSISSLKTSITPLDSARLLKAARFPRFLVSAHDVANAAHQPELVATLFECRGAGAQLLLDSGNYEAFWTRDATWSQRRFHEVLELALSDVAFSFDQQTVPPDVALAALAATSNAANDSRASSTPIVPIVHGPGDLLPTIAASVASSLHATAVAVPERELGVDLVQRFKSVRAIRDALGPNESIRLHLLGTGNPTSMLVYAYAGADSFDGLEWCQTVVDHSTGLLHHLSHYPLFSSQTEWAESGVSPLARALVHNLAFYRAWEHKLVAARASGTLRSMIEVHSPTVAALLAHA